MRSRLIRRRSPFCHHRTKPCQCTLRFHTVAFRQDRQAHLSPDWEVLFLALKTEEEIQLATHQKS
jgi:hypothetical protein